MGEEASKMIGKSPPQATTFAQSPRSRNRESNGFHFTMERWSGKIAVVTGASAGIGAAVVKDLLAAGLIVVGLARRVEKVEAIKQNIQDPLARSRMHAFKCDVSSLESIREAFAWIESQFGVVNILINNAGVSKSTMILTEGNEAELRSVVDTNLVGLVNCTKAAFQLMAKNDADGHIVNVNSILGHSAAPFGGPAPIVNIYPSTKFGVTAATEMVRQELNFLKNEKVKVSSISPGLVKTDIIEAGGFEGGNLIFERLAHLMPEDVSHAIMFILGTPPKVQVHDLILKPVGEAV